MNIRRFGVWANLLVGAVLMLAVWAMFVWVASRPVFRMLIDMTPQRVNTVDPVTEQLLRDLRAEEAEVEFHLFRQEISGQPRDDSHAQGMAIRTRLLEMTNMLLRRYAALGGESVTVVQQSPFDDTAAYREAAQAFSYTAADGEALVVAVRQKGKERRFRKLSLLSDLAVIDLPPANQQGPVRRASVPILKDYQGEMAISSAIKGLLVQGIPIVYVLRGYSSTVDFGDASALGYGKLVSAMTHNGFEVRPLKLRDTGRVPADAAMVICIEPNRDFLPRHADALYDYVKRGGQVFLNYGWSAVGMNPDGGKFGELLGYRVSRQPVFHRIADSRGGPSMDGTEVVAHLALIPNSRHPTTKTMAESGRPIEVYLARALSERAGAPGNVRREPLLSTGREGWLAIPGPDGQPSYRSPAIALHSFVVGMACEIDPIDDDEGASDEGAGGTAPGVPGRVVVVSGAFCNNRAFQFFGTFALNICNWMTERRVLLDIAGANYEVRNLDIKPQNVVRIWWLLVIYVPGTFLAMGLIMWWRRRH